MLKPMCQGKSPCVFLPSINRVLGTSNLQIAPLTGHSSSLATNSCRWDSILSPAYLWLSKTWSLLGGLRELYQSFPGTAGRWGIKKKGLIHWMLEREETCYTSFHYTGSALLAQLTRKVMSDGVRNVVWKPLTVAMGSGFPPVAVSLWNT